MPSPKNKGFSLFEILIVVALIGLLGGLVVANMGSLFAGVGDEPLPETLRRAVREARYLAGTSKETVFLKYDAEEAVFRFHRADGTELGTMTTQADNDQDKVVFYRLLPLRGITVPDMNAEREETAQIGFHPDRSATPFVAEIHYSGEVLFQRFDPFSNLKVEVQR